MKKESRKISNKGFVLAETLVVAVAVTTIFALLFKHFYPLIGEYEIREHYDDIDSKYGTYWIKKMIQSDNYHLITTTMDRDGYVQFSCENLEEENKNMCYQMLVSLEVSCDNIGTTDKIEKCENHSNSPHIYITKYNLSGFKSKINNNNNFTSGLKDYLIYLPDYKAGSLNGAQYRIVVEYYRHRFDTEDYDDGAYIIDLNDYLTFSTIEVMK